MDNYEKNGYFIHEKLFDDKFIDNLIEKIKLPIMNYCNYYNISYNLNKNNLESLYEQLNNIYNIDKELYFNFIKQNGILSQIIDIKGMFNNENIITLLNKLNFKNISVPITPQVNFYCDFAINNDYRNGQIGIDAHQDWSQTRGSLNALNLWIPLVDINENNCPLMVVPNSSNDGFINGNRDSHVILIDKYKEEDYIKIIMSKGDCIVFNGWVVHKTGKFQNNEKIRIAIAIRFNDLDNNYFIGNQYHTAYKTIMNHDKFQSRIPYLDEIQKIYNKDIKPLHYTDLYNKRKFWYNYYGRYIENYHERLLKLHRFIKCDDMSKEIIEQLLILKYLNQDSKVLELGGNIGRVSQIIACILNNDSNLVVIEPTKNIAELNKKNKEINCFNYHIETKIISNKPLFLKINNRESVANKIYSEYIEDSEIIENITFSDLQNKYDIIFDTLIIDCEGSFYQILKDEPNILNNIKMIIIENDFDNIEQYDFIYNEFLNNKFILIDTQQSYPIAVNQFNEKYMYQVFIK